MHPAHALGSWWAASSSPIHDLVEYRVEIVDRDYPITRGIGDFTILSEQYYMHVDPANRVLATTTFETRSAPWINGTRMPVAWTRQARARARLLLLART
jgi:type 1 glutamine amidotransferase